MEVREVVMLTRSIYSDVWNTLGGEVCIIVVLAFCMKLVKTNLLYSSKILIVYRMTVMPRVQTICLQSMKVNRSITDMMYYFHRRQMRL